MFLEAETLGNWMASIILLAVSNAAYKRKVYKIWMLLRLFIVPLLMEDSVPAFIFNLEIGT